MNYLYLVLALFALVLQSVIGFMIAVFSTSGDPSAQVSTTLTSIGMYGIPLSALAGAILLFVGYAKHWQHVYLWALLPVPVIVLWIVALLITGAK
jgi:hypothetical protein